MSDARVLFRTGFRNTVYDSMRCRPGWRHTDSDLDWDINWADVGWIRDYLDHIRLDEHQRVNHFKNHYELTRKDLLVKNVKRMRKQLERADAMEEAARYTFLPDSYVLPGDYGLFVEAFKRDPGHTWIMKPIGRAQGKGIFLFTKLSEIKEWKKGWKWDPKSSQAETYIASRYIENPYTIGGKKFDLRLYALVTSFSPLNVWLYRSGFARFSGQRYSSVKSDIDNLFVHLTNVAIQKTAEGYSKAKGCKMDLTSVKLLLASKHGMPAVDRLFAEMQSVILRSLIAVSKVMQQDRHCFELYGYDLLFDTDLKPWLIEVNASPSLSADTDSDYELKRMLVEDTLSVVDVEGHNTGMEVQIGGFDLIWQGGPIHVDRPPTCSTYLGCINNRGKQMKVLRPEYEESPTARTGAGAGAGAGSGR